MAQLRSVNTKFWEDPWIEELNVSEKLLFLYLITNRYANLAGIYEITVKRINYETGINKETILKALERFGMVRKAYFVNDNYILLPNWLKNQNLNTNMKKGVVKIISELPIDVKINTLGNDYQTIQNDYQSIRNTLLKYEVEVLEDEVIEYEDEVEDSKNAIPVFNEFLNHALSKEPNISEKHLKLKYDAWIENGWKDGNDRKIKNWKSKLTNTIQFIQINKNGINDKRDPSKKTRQFKSVYGDSD